jgi:hypothetical protein
VDETVVNVERWEMAMSTRTRGDGPCLVLGGLITMAIVMGAAGAARNAVDQRDRGPPRQQRRRGKNIRIGTMPEGRGSIPI